METNHKTYTSLCILFVFLLSSFSDANSIVKNLPGFDGDLPFTLETGYVGVGANEEIQLFYYFVESQRDPLHDPLLLYLTGGPGTSGLYPFLYQIGPLSINFDNSTWEKLALEINPNSWAKTANVLYVDLPAGTGFSYATTYNASKSSDSILAKHSYKFLIKWLEDHPRFLNNPLYVTGISYMGILVPVVTLEVYKGNERGDQPQLNIKGSMIVSPLTDKFNDFNSRFEFAHRLALISDDIYESAKKACNGNYIDVYTDPKNSACASSLQRVDECTSRINAGNILDPFCDDVNPDPTCREAAAIYLEYFGNDKEVQKALHVREGTVETFEKTNETIHYVLGKNDTECYSYDIFSSLVYHKMLFSRKCQVLILSGDHDFTFPYVGAEEWIQSLNLPVESPWKPWFVNNQVAGYRMKYAKNEYSLTYGTVKGAGHSIPLYKPEEAWIILDGWLSSHSYSSDI
ncbi:putative peptidase S10, serine carboxypeptidase, alpha/Beta hydrolase [Helianthus annuus]|uniref:Peptidase S10, serine carboxypeptidase, alpha/Beta hydrolase n=1 Tax=Helianthus annuus TaxID=4232 RepID=A0A251UUT3_HELAN|nr:serine carboxypeptidase-like 7 [Helianthus annuus]KAF5812751.1 putative peptidase S10, serine carboxypeptidase, alpha/Beta hydrolase [Helianthus annuus]